jgi:hypothetical protein
MRKGRYTEEQIVYAQKLQRTLSPVWRWATGIREPGQSRGPGTMLSGDDHFLMKSPICRSLFGMWVFNHKSRNPSNVLICAAESRSDFQRGTRDRNLRIM